MRTELSFLSWAPIWGIAMTPPQPWLIIICLTINYEIRLESLGIFRHMLLSLRVSSVDSEVSYRLCGSHETGWSGCACSLAQIRPLLCATYSAGLDHQYAPHARAGLLHGQQAPPLSEWRLSDVITLRGRRGHCHQATLLIECRFKGAGSSAETLITQLETACRQWRNG